MLKVSPPTPFKGVPRLGKAGRQAPSPLPQRIHPNSQNTYQAVMIIEQYNNKDSITTKNAGRAGGQRYERTDDFSLHIVLTREGGRRNFLTPFLPLPPLAWKPCGRPKTASIIPCPHSNLTLDHKGQLLWPCKSKADRETINVINK